MDDIVVGVDGSDGSVQAATLAGRIAEATGVKLTVVHVAHLPVPPTDPALDPATLLAAAMDADRRAEAAAAAVLDPTGVPWAFQTRTGDPVQELQRAGQELGAELLVVGGRGRSALERLVLGSVADRLIHHADRPVLVVNGRVGWGAGLGRMLVGVDGSDASVQAVRVAGQLALATGAALTVAYIRTIPPGYQGPPIVTSGQLERYFQRVERRATRRVGRVLGPLGVAWDLRVPTGDPAEELDRVAGEVGADLIVVGCRGQSPVGRVLLGSTSTRLARQAARPVLVVR